jgi:hypothetical protein
MPSKKKIKGNRRLGDRAQLPLWTLLYAFSYALGRKSYAVSDVCGELIRHWTKLSKTAQRRIQEDIAQCEDLGEEVDRRQWMKVSKLKVE